MNPYVTPLVAQTVIADKIAAADAYRRAKAARAGRASRTKRLSRSSVGRPDHRIELTWPDGVCSVVSADEPSVSAGNQARGLADSRR